MIDNALYSKGRCCRHQTLSTPQAGLIYVGFPPGLGILGREQDYPHGH